MEPVLNETIAIFQDDPDSEYAKDLYSRLSFFLDQVLSYNNTTDGTTTLALKDGRRYEAFIDYCTFDELVKTHTKAKTIKIISKEGNYKYQEQTDKKF